MRLFDGMPKGMKEHEDALVKEAEKAGFTDSQARYILKMLAMTTMATLKIGSLDDKDIAKSIGKMKSKDYSDN